MTEWTAPGDERGIEPLVRFLRGHDAEMRRTAAVALGSFDDRRAVEALAEALRDRDAEVRRCAAASLGLSASPAAVPALVKALADPSDAVREAAEGALEQVGEAAVLELIVVLHNGPLMTRHSAAAVLGRIADTRAITPLLDVLRGYVSYGALHISASAALGEIALRHPVPELREALPLLRGLATWAKQHQETMRRIEAATVGSQSLPVPAPPPAASPRDLPIPASSPASSPEPELGALPIPSAPELPGSAEKPSGERNGTEWEQEGLLARLRDWIKKAAHE